MKIFKIFHYLNLILFLMALDINHAQIIDFGGSAEISEETLKYDDFIESDSDQISNSSYLNIPVTLSVKNSSMERCLKKIAKVAGVNIIYDNDLIDADGINLDVENEPLRDILEELFEGKDISFYEYKDGEIIIAKSKRVDEKTGAIRGVVKDDSGELLISANIIIVGTSIGCATDYEGAYHIKNLKPGTYTLKASMVGYETITQKVIVTAGKITQSNLTIHAVSFEIGGIEVVGTTELLPTDVNTKTTISSGEIEHFQASSVKDVLDLVPGVQKSDNPGLSKTSQIAVRSDDGDKLSAFGTLVVVDGSPVSNNANMQFEKSAANGYNNMGAGVDLRTIPADNIESIEIVTGLPSVRYGDVTEGVINIKTKIGTQPHRLKIKNNPDTREANLGGGFKLDDLKGLSYNFNLAQSERDIKKDGDEYTRITGQTVFSSNSLENKLNLNHKLNGQIILDEENPKGDVYQTHNYNRGYSVGYSSWGKLNLEQNTSSLEYNLFLNFRKENSMKSKLVQSDLRVLPNGDTVSTYIGKVETKGNEWGLGGRIEWNRIAFTGDFVHKLLFGTDLKYDANTGDGVMFDTLFSIYGVESGRRPYSFDEIPGQLLASLYAEDKITGHFVFDFNLMLGLRYEMYRPYEFNIKGLWGDGDIINSRNGTYFNPRMNLMIYLSKINQLRLSAGVTSKSPSMATLYPPEEVFRWKDPNLNKILYMRYNTTVPDLKGYKENQFEVAYDHKFFDRIGTSVSAYYKERRNETENQDIPVFVKSIRTGKDVLYYVDEYTTARNLGWTNIKGLEFSIRTNKIKPLNMEFSVVGSYSKMNSSRNGTVYSNTFDTTKGQLPNFRINVNGIDTLIGMVYQPEGRWSDRFQLNYYVKYTLPPLGLWVTLRAEHLVSESYQSYNQKPEDISRLTDAGKESYYFARAVKIKPAKWLFNLSISKSLFKGAEISFYVNNFLDDPGLRTYRSSPTAYTQEKRNPDLFYGIEFSATVDDLL